jgi:murein DD-endopeptidase MepM/ murein hydrolase activator NlpD
MRLLTDSEHDETTPPTLEEYIAAAHKAPSRWKGFLVSALAGVALLAALSREPRPLISAYAGSTQNDRAVPAAVAESLSVGSVIFLECVDVPAYLPCGNPLGDPISVIATTGFSEGQYHQGIQNGGYFNNGVDLAKKNRSDAISPSLYPGSGGTVSDRTGDGTPRISYGSPVYAICSGSIDYGVSIGNRYILTCDKDSDGNFYKTYGGHLKAFAENISSGGRVSRGQLIAYVGNTGTPGENDGANYAHLHNSLHYIDAQGNEVEVDPRADELHFLSPIEEVVGEEGNGITTQSTEGEKSNYQSRLAQVKETILYTSPQEDPDYDAKNVIASFSWPYDLNSWEAKNGGHENALAVAVASNGIVIPPTNGTEIGLFKDIFKMKTDNDFDDYPIEYKNADGGTEVVSYGKLTGYAVTALEGCFTANNIYWLGQVVKEKGIDFEIKATDHYPVNGKQSYGLHYYDPDGSGPILAKQFYLNASGEWTDVTFINNTGRNVMLKWYWDKNTGDNTAMLVWAD